MLERSPHRQPGPYPPVYSHEKKEDRMLVFLHAEKEIAKMLADNLLVKFKATDEYKEVAGELMSEAA